MWILTYFKDLGVQCSHIINQYQGYAEVWKEPSNIFINNIKKQLENLEFFKEKMNTFSDYYSRIQTEMEPHMQNQILYIDASQLNKSISQDAADHKDALIN